QFPLEGAFRFLKERSWHARRAGEQGQAQARSRRSLEARRRAAAAGRRCAMRSVATSSRRSRPSLSRSACTRRWTRSAAPSSTFPASWNSSAPAPSSGSPLRSPGCTKEGRDSTCSGSCAICRSPSVSSLPRTKHRRPQHRRPRRRAPGTWRADREVLEEARRAVEFVQKLYDAYADGWADQPLTKDLGEQTAAELDRFLAWTQLDRYVELAVLASTNVPRPSKPGQHVISAAKEVVPQPPVTEASPGAVVADSEPGPAGEPEEEPASPQQPVVEPELGRD